MSHIASRAKFMGLDVAERRLLSSRVGCARTFIPLFAYIHSNPCCHTLAVCDSIIASRRLRLQVPAKDYSRQREKKC